MSDAERGLVTGNLRYIDGEVRGTLPPYKHGQKVQKISREPLNLNFLVGPSNGSNKTTFVIYMKIPVFFFFFFFSIGDNASETFGGGHVDNFCIYPQKKK